LAIVNREATNNERTKTHETKTEKTEDAGFVSTALLDDVKAIKTLDSR
jgi:hypothetical protein